MPPRLSAAAIKACSSAAGRNRRSTGRPTAASAGREIDNGFPVVDRGRIAIAVSPQKPDTVYALVAAAGKESGFFRSLDRGATWQRMSNYIVVDPQYYGEIYPDPHRAGRVYAVDVRINVTEDDGKTFRPMDWNMGQRKSRFNFSKG